jgi:hypothetical protein
MSRSHNACNALEQIHAVVLHSRAAPICSRPCHCHAFVVSSSVVTLLTPCLHVPQVLANPSAELQEAPGVTREQLRERGIRPYDEKVPASTVQQPMCTLCVCGTAVAKCIRAVQRGADLSCAYCNQPPVEKHR